MQPSRALLSSLLLLLSLPTSALAADPAEDGHRLIGLLDYISADYPGAVSDGKVADEFEYNEQKELLSQATVILGRHPEAPQELSQAIASLNVHLNAMADPALVRADALRARGATIAHFKVVMAPAKRPELARGESLYASNCASCHGAAGAGDGPAAAPLTPKPANFTDPGLRDGLSPYRAFNTTTFGVEGTSMRAFSELSDKDRWDLAFYVLAIGHGGATQLDYKAPAWATLDVLASSTDADLKGRPDVQTSDLAALRTHTPFHVAATGDAPLDVVNRHLDAVEQSLAKDDLAQAQLEAVSAYLDGFEPVESQLSTTDADLTRKIEQEFLTMRGHIKANDKAAALASLAVLRAGVKDAEATLSRGQTTWSIALASGFILLREGIEIVLLLALLLGMTTRAGRPEGKRAIHAGWLSAVAAGGLTWFAAAKLIAVSGAQREFVEGVVALLASAMLFSVSYWFLAKLHGERWAAFLKKVATEQIAGGRFATLTLISFLAAYREIFEMVLFYQSMLLESPDALSAILGGAFVGATLLAIVAYSILKLGKKLPLTPFFRTSGLLLYGLSVVMLGKGLHALTTAGWTPLWQLPGVPTIPALGIFPEVISISAQLVLIVAALGWGIAQRREANAATA